MKTQQLRQIIREEIRRTLNEGPLVNAITPAYTGDLGKAVKALEKYLMTQLPSGEDEKKMWDKLAYLVIDIVDEAEQKARDEYDD